MTWRSEGKKDSGTKEKDAGSTFDSWLREEGAYEEASATAIKRVVACQVEAAMDVVGREIRLELA